MKLNSITTLIAVSLIPCMVFSQNLVPNPSFEFYTNCPSFSPGDICQALPWFQPVKINGDACYYSTTDYFNACDTSGSHPAGVPDNWFGYQNARTGVAYAGIVTSYLNIGTNYREYLEIKLSDSLKQSKLYCITFYINRAEKYDLAADRIGAYFSRDSIIDTTGAYEYLPFIPDMENASGNVIYDTINWTKISGTFLANGGEQFMTIGNFRDDFNTIRDTVTQGGTEGAYYYVDDVSVIELPPDSTSCFEGVGVDELKKQEEILVYPNPVSDNLTIEISSSQQEKKEVSIYNTLGEKILAQNFSAQKYSLNVSAFAKGIYFIMVTDEAGNRVVRKVVKM